MLLVRWHGSPRCRVPEHPCRVRYHLSDPIQTPYLSSLPSSAFNAAGPKCYNCQQFGHIARSCPNAPAAAVPADGAAVAAGVDGAVAPVAVVPVIPRAAPLGARIGGFAPRGGFMGARGGFMGARGGTSTLRWTTLLFRIDLLIAGTCVFTGRCYGCGGFGHLARNCPTAANFAAPRGPKLCYKVGHTSLQAAGTIAHALLRFLALSVSTVPAGGSRKSRVHLVLLLPV